MTDENWSDTNYCDNCLHGYHARPCEYQCGDDAKDRCACKTEDEHVKPCGCGKFEPAYPPDRSNEPTSREEMGA